MSVVAATRRIAFASALVACIAFAPAARASVAHCHLTVYVQFSKTSYASTGSELPNCTGQIGDQLLAPGGSVAASGSYRPEMLASGRCGLAVEAQSFEADLPSALGFFENPLTNLTGKLAGMSAGALSALLGSASAEGIPLAVRGTGVLTRGAGQSCAAPSSGTLEENLLLSDGRGDPPADTSAAAPPASAEAPEHTSSAAPAAAKKRRPSHRKSHKRKRHHRAPATPGYPPPTR